MDDSFWNTYAVYINRLNYEAEDHIWSIIDKIETVNNESVVSTLSFIYHNICLFIFVGKKYNEDFPFKNIQNFFCKDYPDGEILFNKYSKILKPNEETSFSNNMVKDYFCFCAEVIPEHIMQVLNDNPNDRHWSAVSVSGTIKSYLIIKNQFFEEEKPIDIKGYFLDNGFSDSEFEAFESLRLKESAFYRGIQL